MGAFGEGFGVGCGGVGCCHASINTGAQINIPDKHIPVITSLLYQFLIGPSASEMWPFPDSSRSLIPLPAAGGEVFRF
jgi:hypothetical protein